jgi:hypothetical protein
MKKILMTAIIATLSFANAATQNANIEACKTYINEAKSFHSTMEMNKVSHATLAFYKEKIVSHCGNVIAKPSYEQNIFATLLIKKDTVTANSCKLAIQMAKTYHEGNKVSPVLSKAHKVNMVDNCGTLVAKKAPAFCLFENVNETIEENTVSLKEKCLVAINKAHSAVDKNRILAQKEDIVLNCGNLPKYL